MAAGGVRLQDLPFESEFPELDSALSKIYGCAVDNLRRLDDLRRALTSLREGVGPSKDKVWPQLLAKFHLVSRTYQILSQNLIYAMRTGGLVQYAVFPKTLPTDPDMVTELLRTRIEGEREVDGDNGKSATADADREEENWDQVDVAKRVEDYNAQVEGLFRTLQDLRRDLDNGARALAPVDSGPFREKRNPGQEERHLLMAVQRGVGLN